MPFMTSLTPAFPFRAPTPTRRGGLLATIGAVLLLAAVAVACAQSKADDPVLAKVNGAEIRQSDLAFAEEDVGQSVPAGTPESRRDWLINYVSDMLLLAKAAEQIKLQDTPEFKKRLAFARNKALMDTVLKSTGKAAVTDEAMHRVYEDALKQMTQEQEVHARHILFRVPDPGDEKASKEAEAKAKAALDRVRKGEDFAKLAAELTEDPAGRDEGGDLGYFGREQMLPEFADAAFKLDKGQISDPVRTQFGWHIVKLEDKRKRQPPQYEHVKQQLETFVARKAQVELVTKLRSEAKIERLQQPASDGKGPEQK
jgi:peptidyl-prolyl cis-trans isomerase C